MKKFATLVAILAMAGSISACATITRGTATPGAYHNTGGLAFWFLRAERYGRHEGMPFPLVRDRLRKLPASTPQESPAAT